jgi:hypothetical protein
VPTPAPFSIGYYRIAAKHSGKVLDIGGVSINQGTKAQQWDDVSGSNQQWLLVPAGINQYQIVARHSGRALDIDSASTANGALMHQWSRHGGDSQKWTVTDLGNGSYKIINVRSGKALEVQNSSMVNGGSVQQWDYAGQPNQQWSITPAAVVRDSRQNYPAYSPKPTDLVVSRTEYLDQLQGLWIGESIANWTGLRTELVKTGPAFFTDSDWGKQYGIPSLGNGMLEYAFTLDDTAWGSDDDTDIEYMYQHLLYTNQTSILTPQQIKDGWLKHIYSNEDAPNGENFLWVSNESAYYLMMNSGLLPLDTSLPAKNPDYYMIDAQLTTEIFGAFAPARPDVATRLSHLPIRTTAYNDSEWVAEFYVRMYSLATAVDKNLPMKDRIRWMATQARTSIPPNTPVAAIYDFVKSRYDANPDKNNWEQTRDEVYQRYCASSNDGYQCFIGFEANINFAASLVSLFYGEGDYAKTVRLGALMGWDSDNPAATWGGLLGFMIGRTGVAKAVNAYNLSDTYRISRTRRNFPDYLPNNDGEDNFIMMAERGLAIVDRVVINEMGGGVDLANDRWYIPAAPPVVTPNPTAVNIAPIGTIVASVTAPTGSGNKNINTFRDGIKPASGSADPATQFDSYVGNTSSHTENYGYTFPVNHVFSKLVYVEGMHFTDGGFWANGTLKVQIRQGGTWVDQAVTPSPAYPNGNTQTAFGSGFQTYTFNLGNVTGNGIRITGTAGGTSNFVSIAELEVWEPVANTRPTISSLDNIRLAPGATSSPLSFTIGDAETPVASLKLSATTDNTSLVPNTGITFGGTGANRTVTITSAAGKTGTANVTIQVEDTMGGKASTAFAVVVGSAYNSWAGVQSPPLTGGPLDDQDSDGLANIVEYAFGLNPVQINQASALPRPVYSNGSMVVTYTQPASVAGITYGAQWSDDLVTWNNIPDTGSGSTHTFSVPTAGHARLFFRHTVALAP